MGAYIYRLKGTKSFTTEIIEGKPEKVYDLVYWYKPSFSGFWGKEPSWMKPIHMLDARLRNSFDKIGYPKFVRMVCEKDGKIDREGADTAMEWKDGMICINDYSVAFEQFKKYKLNVHEPIPA